MLSNGKHSQSDEYTIGYDRNGSVDSDACDRWCFVTKTNTQALHGSVLPFRGLLERELEAMGIRLNKKAPNIYFKVSYSSLCVLWLL